MDNTITFLSIIRLINKKKKHLFSIVILSAVLSGISAMLITSKYKSEAILYPSNIAPYSVETQTEQIEQLLQSDLIMQTVIKEFDLATRYEIDTNKAGAKAELVKEYEANVRTERTEFESIRLSVMDKDPKTAAAIANRIIDMVNEKARELHRANMKDIVLINKENLDDQSRKLDSLQNARKDISKNYHILEMEQQTREAYRGLFNANSSKAEAKELIKNMEEKGEDWLRLTSEIKRQTLLYAEIKDGYEKSVYDLKKHLSYVNVVVKPYPNDKKAYPIRWLIVVSTVVSTLILTITLFILIEYNPFRNLQD